MRPHRVDRALRWRGAAAATLAVAGLLLAPSAHEAPASGTATTPSGASGAAVVRVIVQAQHGMLDHASAAAAALGGAVVATQTALDTVVTDLPASAVARLRTSPGVVGVTPDGRVHLDTAGVGPTGLPGDMTNQARLTGATTFWRNGSTGQGVDVALIDSGVAPCPACHGRSSTGPTFVRVADPASRYLDTFGHGTLLAGIIAGHDAGRAGDPEGAASGFLGIAPGARCQPQGGRRARRGDVSQVIAAIDWVVQHAHDKGLNIRVLNLSFGTDSRAGHQIDPLAYAAEVAWQHGIVVVASAGNHGGRGPDDPAVRPHVARRRAPTTPRHACRSTTTPSPPFTPRGRHAPPRPAGPGCPRPGPARAGLVRRRSSRRRGAARRRGSSAAAGPRRRPPSRPAPWRCCSSAAAA